MMELMEEIPHSVAEAVRAYRTANHAAIDNLRRAWAASQRGDEAEARSRDAARDTLRLEQDRTRVRLDEAIRGWT